jgi:hypothetical protein
LIIQSEPGKPQAQTLRELEAQPLANIHRENAMTATLAKLKATENAERAFAQSNPLTVGDRVHVHSGYCHAICKVTAVSDKAIQLTGRPDSSSPIITAWFPKSALDHRAYQCPDEIAHNLDIKGWFQSKLNRYQEKLIGLLD